MLRASIWREQQSRRRDIRLAWYTAALARAKRLPRLAELLAEGENRKLTGDGSERRKQEFRELKQRMGNGDGR